MLDPLDGFSFLFYLKSFHVIHSQVAELQGPQIHGAGRGNGGLDEAPGFVLARRGLVIHGLEGNLELGFRHDRPLEVRGVSDRHATEEGEGLHEALVVLREEPLALLVDEADDTEDVAGVSDRHAEHCLGQGGGVGVQFGRKPGKK